MVKFIGIVDDDAEILEVYSVMLQGLSLKYGYEVKTFLRSIDFIKFVESLREEISDAVLLADINMPGMDGISLLDYCHSNHPNIKVIMQTGMNEPNYVRKAFQSGASDYFIKPIDFRALISRIENKIEKECFH